VKDFRRIVAAWFEIDSDLQLREHKALQRKATKKEKQIRDLRNANDRAYFLLLFAHFEDHLNTLAHRLISRRQASSTWNRRRSWDTIQLGNLRRVPFRARLSYCLDSQGPDWQTVSNYYGIRNQLAHVGSTATPFVVSAVAADLMLIAKALKSR
jgi:hypothetical protein